MKFFKNSDLIKRYDISDKAVRNWIQAAKEGKYELELYQEGEATYIADSISNVQLIKELVEKGRKYRNHRTYRYIEPLPSFYETFQPSHIYDIINRLEIDQDLPGQYKYFGAGADYWNNYLYKLKESGSSNVLSNTIETIELNIPYIEKLTKGYKYVNVVNVCIGNCLTLEELLKHLSRKQRLNQVKLIDISEDMLQISKRHIAKWLGNNFDIQTYARDISYQRFDDVLMSNSYGEDASETVNLIFLAAGPIANFHYPDQALYTIGSSMSKSDLLVTTLKRDTQEAQSFFDFGIKGEGVLISRHDSFLLQQLNIDPSFYDVEQFYDPNIKMRSIQIRLKVDLCIGFNLGNFSKQVGFKRGDQIRLWKAWHHSDKEILRRFDRTGFEVLNMSKSIDEELNFLITRIKPFISTPKCLT